MEKVIVLKFHGFNIQSKWNASDSSLFDANFREWLKKNLIAHFLTFSSEIFPFCKKLNILRKYQIQFKLNINWVFNLKKTCMWFRVSAKYFDCSYFMHIIFQLRFNYVPCHCVFFLYLHHISGLVNIGNFFIFNFLVFNYSKWK